MVQLALFRGTVKINLYCDSLSCTVSKLQAERLTNGDSVPGEGKILPLLQSIQIGPGTHVSFYSMGTSGFLHKLKAARMCSLSLTIIQLNERTVTSTYP